MVNSAHVEIEGPTANLWQEHLEAVGKLDAHNLERFPEGNSRQK